MANLLVRQVDEEIAQALKARAGRHGISAEEEHRRILRMALLTPKRKSFAQAIQSIPNIGKDSDFDRKQEDHQSDVFN